MERVYNFSAGPGVLPEPVLTRAKEELMLFPGGGMSVMEMTHRGKAFMDIFARTKEAFRELMKVPETHEILFLQGGATTQFAAVPLNLMKTGKADYAVTGNFSGKAAKEAEKYGTVHIAATTAPTGHDRIPEQQELSLDGEADYFHYCANNTIFGTAWPYVPKTPSPLVCDMSSEILSRVVDVSQYGLIYAGAQKNMAPAGLTVVIIDRTLAGGEAACTPEILSYKNMIEGDSMLNTPPCWCIYMLGLNLDWVKSQGGVEAMEEAKKKRAAVIYEVLDGSSFYIPHAQIPYRSDMNVTFRTPTEELDTAFVKGAEKRGLVSLKGHRITGGIRASLYNAMPMEGVIKLADYMREFEKDHV